MSFIAFWLILLSVLFHVSWNLMSKASRPSAAFYLITSFAAATITTPFLFWAGIRWDMLPALFYWSFAASCAANILYYTGLFLAYRRSDVSLAYPMMRALPVIFTAVLTAAFGIGKTPSIPALIGMSIVFCGCLLMPLGKLSEFSWRNYWTPALGTIVLAALGTTGYTIFDSMAIALMMTNSPAAKIITCGAYMAILEWIIFLGLLPYLFLSREREDLQKLLSSLWIPLLSGVFTSGAYVLVLLAMPMVTNVSFVQAFRQLGLPLGVIAGVIFLKEKCSTARVTGMLVILVGLILLACC